MKAQKPKVSKSAGGVVVGPSGKIVLVQQRGGEWVLPKGRIEPGHKQINTARREIEEETSLTDLELIKKLGTYERYMLGLNGKEDKSVWKVIAVYLFKTSQSKLGWADKEEILDAQWVDIDDVAKTLSSTKEAEFFKSINNEVKKYERL